jgi:hypothetical protein
MRKSFLENKVGYAATVFLFTAAFAWNVVHGSISAVPGHMLLPPDPWEGVRVVAHGPIMPPDPWEGHAARVA